MIEPSEILRFLREELLDEPDADLSADTSLFRSQRLDSMTLTALVAFLEDRYGIKIRPLDIVYDNLDTVNLIASFVERKQADGESRG